MKKKLKIYSALLIVVLAVLATKFLTITRSQSWTSREGEELYLDSMNLNFAKKIEKATRTWNDTVDGVPVTQSSTDFNWSSKKTLYVDVPVRHRGCLDHYLYSRLVNGQPVLVDMQNVKITVPMENSPQTRPIIISLALVLLVVPFYV